MFAMPQPTQPEGKTARVYEGPHPFIPVAEDRETLHRILTWCDPRILPVIGTLEDIQVVLRVADKYCMEAVTKRVGETLAYGSAGLCPSGSDSVRVYAIAVRYRLDALARKATKYSLDAEWEDLMTEDDPELEHIPGSALHRLQQYRLACGAVAKKWALDWTMCERLPPRHWSKWWIEYMSIAADELYRNPIVES
ncbi:hypothetical protein C8R43DRAFT_946382 [Mycena crocata]|nr:hypothetical protein C8R43DRAFT_946382 [Mycena crocata]